MEDVGLPLPHMGWNRVYPKAGNRLFQGIDDGAYFYFVHSYAMPVNPYTIAQCQYGTPFTLRCKKTISMACNSIRNVQGARVHNC
jgi:glutamine amidotransferase